MKEEFKKEIYKYLSDYKEYCNKWDYDVTFSGFIKWFKSYVMNMEEDEFF